MQQQHRSWLILAHAYLRVSELQQLLDVFGDVASIAAQPRGRLAGAGLSDEKCSAISSPDEKAIDKAVAWLDHDTHHLVAWGEDSYPEMYRGHHSCCTSMAILTHCTCRRLRLSAVATRPKAASAMRTTLQNTSPVTAFRL
jgi:predicted Rossmann fold nucleotide-binding protein DprA/Smf involved in DNA uptake